MIDNAIEIYTKLVAKEPDNKGLDRRLNELRAESDRPEEELHTETVDSSQVEAEPSPDEPENKPKEKEAESIPEIKEIPIEQEEFTLNSSNNEIEQEDISTDYHRKEKILITLQSWIDHINRIKQIRGQS